MKIIDISLPLSPDMPVWPGDPPFMLERVKNMDSGDHVNASYLQASVHMGTHVDAPHHFLNNQRSIDTLSLDDLIGPALVIVLSDDIDIVTAKELEFAAIPPGTKRLLIRTRNSSFWKRKEKRFQQSFVAISEDGAKWIVEHEIRLIGLDYLSIAPYKKSGPTHNVLLEAGLVIVEGLNLSEVETGEYQLCCLPLNLVHSDGAPARAVLMK